MSRDSRSAIGYNRHETAVRISARAANITQPLRLKGERVQFQQKCKTDSDKKESPNQEGIDVDYACSLKQESDPPQSGIRGPVKRNE